MSRRLLLSRYAVTILVLGLLGGTAVALGVIEGFKLEKNPISGPHIRNTFSPVCGCSTHVAEIKFRLRKTGRLTLEVIGPNGRVVRTLVRDRRFFHGQKRFVWDGRDSAGGRVSDGFYRLRLHFGGQHRTIVLPKGTTVDTRPPTVTLVSASPRVISPDDDRVRDVLGVHYDVSEEAHVNVLVDGHVAVRGAPIRPHATLYWPGTLHGRTLPAGVYRISLVAEDLAGNQSRPSRTLRVRIRYVALDVKTIRVKLGASFSLRVHTDARTVQWHFLGRSGSSSRLVVLKATKLGRHAVYVDANGHSARAVVVVARR